jgi:hypothetical protein
VVNTVLEGAVAHVSEAHVSEEVTSGRGRRWNYAGQALAHALTNTGDSLLADFAPQIDGSDIIICPGEVFERTPPKGLTTEQAAAGIAVLVSTCVTNTINDLNLEEARRQWHGRI